MYRNCLMMDGNEADLISVKSVILSSMLLLLHKLSIVLWTDCCTCLYMMVADPGVLKPKQNTRPHPLYDEVLHCNRFGHTVLTHTIYGVRCYI